MPLWLDSDADDFALRFQQVVNLRRETDADVVADVAAILAEVRHNGDAALDALTLKYDGIDVRGDGLVLTHLEIADAVANCPPDLRASLDLAAARIRTFHEMQLPQDREMIDETGTTTGYRWTPIEQVGLYVPGGRASYPSSVLMNAIPAKVAGVSRLAMVTPTPQGHLNPLVLVAAHIAGVDEIYRIGGAQAIAALAYGTARVARVDKITGPGNAWVAEAKRQMFGLVGIDMVAGPSEILVVADKHNPPDWIAADLLSQAEHDPVAQSILITDDADFARQVMQVIDAMIPTLSTAKTAAASWQNFGVIIVVSDLAEVPALVDALAPEHIELAVENPQPLFAAIRHAGSIFIGRHTPEAVGDYVAGPNHVLPTGRRARFSSGLGVLDFMKRSTYLNCTADSLAHIGPATVALAQAEGLPAHALSVALRLSAKAPGA
jgi:histidinol dehydrogenase